jgi:hypothetical protein
MIELFSRTTLRMRASGKVSASLCAASVALMKISSSRLVM